MSEWRRALRHQRERALRIWRLRRPDPAADAALQSEAPQWTHDGVAMAARLTAYFWAAHQRQRHRHGTLAYYPGWPSIYGARNDAVEGVTRLLPLWAAYATSPWAEAALADALLAAVQDAVAHGTDPAHPGYWGDITDRSTLICEAADVALALWLGRDRLWPTLAAPVRQRAMHWLRQALGRRTADNNWHLFVVTIDAVLAQLDPAHRFSSGERLARVQSFAVADGCYTDGPGGAVDLYNAWGFHYSLYWLAEMGALRPDGALEDFCRWYQWLFTPEGLPLFGRSLCYRHAACTPLLLAAVRAPDVVTPGVALAALLANWRSFTTAGGVRAGRPTQGVFGDDVRWLDPYSGPASSLWGTRSLVAFHYTGHGLDWRSVEVEPLPATGTSLDLRVPGLGARVQTDAVSGRSRLLFDMGTPAAQVPLRRRSARDRLRGLVYAVASRPANNLRHAGLGVFASTLGEYR